MNSGNYAGDEDPAGVMTNMTKLFIAFDVSAVLIILAVEAILILRYLRKKKVVSEE